MTHGQSFLHSCIVILPCCFSSISSDLNCIIFLITLLKMFEQIVEIRINRFILFQNVCFCRCTRQTLKSLIRISNYITQIFTMTITVSLQKLSPAFLQNHGPNILPLRRFSTKCLISLHLNRKQVINNNFLINPIEIQFANVVPVWIVLPCCK